MNLKQTIRALTISTARHTKAFVAGCQRHPALASFENARAVILSLRHPSQTADSRAEIIAALVAEYHRGESPVWEGLLVGAFEPMLCAFRSAFEEPIDEDLDQRVLLAFFEALRSPYYSPVMPQISIQRALIGGLRRASRSEDPFAGFLTDDGVLPEPVHRPDESPLDLEEVLRTLPTVRIADDVSQAFHATVFGDETLSEYVDREYADATDSERASIYDRLVHGRARVLLRLRLRLEAASMAA